jgi:hypothetical protein
MSYFKASTKYRKTDSLFRQIILLERPHKCEWCKHTCDPAGMDVSHVLDKGRYQKMRYQKDNVLLLCDNCHRRWHDSPLDAHKFTANYKGAEYENNLRLKDRMIPHKPDLKLCVLLFNRELSTLKEVL